MTTEPNAAALGRLQAPLVGLGAPVVRAGRWRTGPLRGTGRPAVGLAPLHVRCTWQERGTILRYDADRGKVLWDLQGAPLPSSACNTMYSKVKGEPINHSAELNGEQIKLKGRSYTLQQCLKFCAPTARGLRPLNPPAHEISECDRCRSQVRTVWFLCQRIF